MFLFQHYLVKCAMMLLSHVTPFLVIVVTRICGAWDVCKSKTCDHVGSIMLIMDALMDM